MSSYVLDACAILAYLNDESGADIVEEIFLGKHSVFVSSINLLEVCYDAVRRTGNPKAAKLIFDELKQWPIEIVEIIDEKILLAAATFKAKGRISLADSIALALAQIKKSFLVTSDHHEFDIIDEEGVVQFKWIR